MEKKNFLNYIHYFRGLAILFILGLHTSISIGWGQHLAQRKLTIVLFNNGTLLFVFIAGYLFYHLNQHQFNYGQYLKKKALYVILPYILVSIPAILDKLFIDTTGSQWWMDDAFAKEPMLIKVGIMLITGRHMGIFWFIPMIAIVYVLAPLILFISKRKEYIYLAPIVWIAGLFTFRFGYYANIYLSFIYFFPVYIFGIWVYRIKDYLFQYSRTIWIVMGLLFLGISFAEMLEWIPFNEYIKFRDAPDTVYQLNPNKLKMTIFSVLALTFLHAINDKRLVILKLLGDYSFGIYFIHLYVIEVFQLLNGRGFIPLVPLNLISFLIYYLAIITITLVIIKVIKYFLKEKSRYFIGT